MQKLIVVIMGQNCERFIGMCLESVKDADSIVYCSGGAIVKAPNSVLLSKEDDAIGLVYEYQTMKNYPIKIIANKYNQEDKGMNGKQRNFYLKYLKENYPDDWALVLDADEVLEDFGIQKIKNTISQIKVPMLLSPRMHHFVGDLGHEDFTRDVHYVPNRLFKITDDIKYSEVEHPVLQGTRLQGTIDIHVWHLRECLGVFNTQAKHEWNTKKSNMHGKEYLDWWHKSMLLGNYPRKQVYYGNIPTPIKKRFGI